MAEPQIQDQPNSTPITVHSGGVESVPVVAPPEQGAEPQVDLAPDLQPPEVSGELQQAGIRYKTINPPVPEDAKAAGVNPSIPTGPSFAINEFETPQQATEVAKSGNVSTSEPWRALLSLINKWFGRGDKKQPSEA